MSAIQRYVPQSPTPHSPPKTPDESLSGRAQETIATVTPFINVLDTHPKLSVSPDNDSPSSTPGAVTPITPGRPRTESILSGMGINFPADANPLPAGLDGNDDHDPAISSLPSDGRKEGAVHVEQLLAADMTRTLSDPISTTAASVPMGTSKSSAGGMKYPLPRAVSRDNKQLLPSDPSTIIPDSPGRSAISAKSRATSPRVPSTSTFPSSNGFASSSSFYANPTGSEHRERVVSPSRPTFFDSGSNENLPSINTTSTFNALLDEKPPIYSPAIDGKKEPSIKGNPYGTSDLYDPSLYAHPNAQNSSIQARNRSPYPSSSSHNEKAGAYGAHPLTSQSYNHPTTNEALNKVPFKDSVGYWLGMYFFFNLGLTLFNKVVLVSFPFPYTLTGLHALSGCAGCYFALERGAFVPARLTQKENLVLAAFSVLYTINIAVSNISLQLVTVPFHQVVRASTPLFTILIATVILRQKFSFMKLVSLLPVIAGVGFATYGDYYFTAWGLFLTLLGTFLAALKTVVTNLIQTGGGGRLKLHPLDLLMRMSPLAFIQCVAYGWYTGELERVRVYGATQMTRSKAIALLVNGVIACGLNIVSFTANKKAGALTMTVSANCKQVLTIALAVVLFDLHISPTNGIGILLTLIGGGWYGYVEFMEKRQKTVKLVDRS